MRYGIPTILLAWVWAPAALAANEVVPVPNGSFETPAANFTPFGYPPTVQLGFLGDPADFWKPDGGIVFKNTVPFVTNADGSQLATLQSFAGNYLFQQLTGATYQAGKSYSLAAGIGISIALPPAVTDVLRLELGYGGEFAFTPIPGAAVDIVGPGGLSATELKYYATPPVTIDVADPWAGENISLRLVMSSGGGNGYFNVDNVMIPEPGSIGLLLAGAVLLGARRRRG
jgi:hypothetical protein